MPLITVIMLVYNSGTFVRKTIDSILNQSEQDFELLIINDGSSDDTESIIHSYTSDKIRYYANPHNLGIPATYNKAFDLVKGKYIAIAEHDDISHHQRLELQVGFLCKHPKVGAVCAKAEDFSGSLPTSYSIEAGKIKIAYTPEQIRSKHLFKGVGFYNPTAMINADIFAQSGIKYDTTLPPIQDVYLYQRLGLVTDLVCLDCTLIFRQDHPGKITHNKALKAEYPNQGILGTIKFLRNNFNVDIGDVFDKSYKIKDIKRFLILNVAVETIVNTKYHDPQYDSQMLRKNAVDFLYKWLRDIERRTKDYHTVYNAYQQSELLHCISLNRKLRLHLKALLFFRDKT